MSQSEHESTGQESPVPAEAAAVAGQEPAAQESAAQESAARAAGEPGETAAGPGHEAAAQEPSETTEPSEPSKPAAAPEAEVPSPDPSAPPVPAAPKPSRPTTGDTVVDQALEEFDRVTGEPLDTHIEVGERVHRTLQGRLADIGDE
jgi:DNA polymerase-3 subunit gamma/tau